MVRCSSIFLAILTSTFLVSGADARGRPAKDLSLLVPVVDGSPTLAPFQHVRFCLHYPADCKSNPSEKDSIELTAEALVLLNRVNHDVNTAIAPTAKGYGSNLQEGWTIAPDMGDCNDYAVTKRHDLLESGLPAKALRLSVVRTASGIGHLVLVVITTKGAIVLDNLTAAIRPWQSTDYQWLKIQSAADAKFWYEIKAPAGDTTVAEADQRVRLARQ
jgi:predicted transglutaminase-like cysteine proteinase